MSQSAIRDHTVHGMPIPSAGEVEICATNSMRMSYERVRDANDAHA